eukprot:2691632-Pyramimonas_sp.AAC.1
MLVDDCAGDFMQSGRRALRRAPIARAPTRQLLLAWLARTSSASGGTHASASCVAGPAPAAMLRAGKTALGTQT